MTAGVGASAGLPSFSRDGEKLAFRSMVTSISPTAIPFDPVTFHASAPVPLDTAATSRVPVDVSADGRLIAYSGIFDRQEDLFVGPAKGGPLHRITDDTPRDRDPVFTKDGRSLVFYSNRDGGWTVWAIDLDGGNLRRIGTAGGGAIYPLLSPKGDEVVFSGSEEAVFRMPLTVGAAAIRLPGTALGGLELTATGWSPDGSRLIGPMADPSGRTAGVGLYDFERHALKMISTDETYGVRWLRDGRHVLYFDQSGWQLVVLDTLTGARTVVDVTLPARAVAELFAVSPDNRTVYYGAVRAEADIWLVERR